ACLLLSLTAPSWASPTLKDYGSLPAISEMSVSPNGETVAFRKVQDDLDALIVVSLSQKKPLPGLELSQIQPKTINFLDDENIFLQASTFGRVAGFRGKFET